jgi:hypothetical protein
MALRLSRERCSPGVLPDRVGAEAVQANRAGTQAALVAGQEDPMTKKRRTHAQSIKAKAPRDLSAGLSARKVKAGVNVKLERCFVKSWSTSGA